MRILIIAPPRTGGNIFSKWLSSELSYKWIHEPFNPNHNMLDKIEHLFSLDNIVVKLITFEWEDYYNLNQITNKFDKIIGLTRDNLFDTAVSFVKALETNNFTKRYNINDEWIENNRELINTHLNYIKILNDYTKKINNSLQITYEEIYNTKNDIKKVVKYLNMGELKYFDMLDNKNKYKNNNNPIKFI
jgi:hypothetical protein